MHVRDRWHQWLAVGLFTLAMGHCVFFASAESLSQEEIQSGWLHLFDGTMSGWTASGGEWQTKDNMLSSDMSFSRRIVTAYPIPDFLLEFDYRLSATPSGAALRIRTSRDGEPADSGYRIPLSDSTKEWPQGSIVNRSAAQPASLALGSWHSVRVEALGDHIKVEIDGRTTADIHDDAARSGFIAFESTRGVSMDVRDVRLKPLNIKQVFDGSDLAGWKNIPYQPVGKKGLLHVFGGGESKPHSADWSVKEGSVHGEKGPGSIESGAQFDNFILQLRATATVEPNKKDVYPALYARNSAGTFATGYPLGIGSHIGEIGDLAKPRKPVDNSHGNVLETVIADGRNFYIFLNGTLSTVYHDTRPEATSLKQGARVSSGAFSLEIPKDASAVNLSTIAAASIPAGAGGTVKPLPAAPPPSAIAPAVAPTSQDTGTQAAQIAAALGVPTPQVRSRSAELISRAVKSSDPQEQMQLYDQVIKIDPANGAAIQGYKDAQQKLEQQQAQQMQQQQATQQQEATQSETAQQLQRSLASAEASFLGGHIRDADRSLSIAERLAPSNPLVNDLRSRINAATSLRHRLYFTGGAVGLLALSGGTFFLFRRRRSNRHPVLEVLRGLDQGRKYPLDRDVVRIGAVAQDGGQKNDIVVRDIEHLVSRFHCELIKKEGQFLLKDMNSSNGTKVNGENISPGRPVPLKKGARIDLGGTVVLRLDYERKRA
jgi:predicted component of type VI protein secretion system